MGTIELTNTDAMIWPINWGCPLLEQIPSFKFANEKTWRDMAKGTNRAPGKNHPRVGEWLIDRYAPANGICADPMCGPGSLWIKAPLEKVGAFYAAEIELHLMELAKINLQLRGYRNLKLQCADARTWDPGAKMDLVLFSPPFLQNHTAGVTPHQQQLLERKRLHAMQEFGAHPENLGRMKAVEFWPGIQQVYTNLTRYLKPGGYAAVILRNRIAKGQEVDEVGRHITLMRAAGLHVVGVHMRDLVRPTGYQAWKVARDQSTPWIRYEWAVVARLST